MSNAPYGPIQVARWKAILLSLTLLSSAAVAQLPKALVSNGSFESGDRAPDHWTLTGPGAWSKGSARHGQYFVHVASDSPAGQWLSDAVQLSPGTDYRLEGWVRAPKGKAHLELQFLNDKGGIDHSSRAPEVRDASEWRYVALDFKPATPTARIRFAADTAADLDDVALQIAAVPYLGNRDVQSDAKGRIGLWGEEKESSVSPGTRAGTHRADNKTQRRQLPSLLVESTGDWYAVSSVNYGLMGFTERIQLSGWARTEGPAAAQILACWMDDTQHVLRVDAGPEQRGADWQKLTLAPDSPPAGAHTVRLVALARGGRVYFDEFDLLHLPSPKPIARVLVNQVGYDLGGPKSAVVATNFFPRDRDQLTVQLIDASGSVQLTKNVSCNGRIYSGTPDDWGWYFWRADFSQCKQAGTYRIAIATPEVQCESIPFVVERGAILNHTAKSAVDFFFIQRCGFEVPGWHKACHLDDATLSDGTHVDVTGGWHSAGDYNKPMWQFGDSGACYALAAALEDAPQPFSRFDREGKGMIDALDEGWWGAKFLAKMQNSADGSMRGDVLQGPARTWMRWEAPDVHTDNKVGTPDDPVISPTAPNVPLTVAAWAKMARALDGRKIENDYLERAVRLWNYLTVSESAASNPLLLIGALELHRSTNDDKYRRFATEGAAQLVKAQNAAGALPGDTGDHGNLSAAALALVALQYPDEPLRAPITAALARYMDFCVARTDNPFGLTRQGTEGAEPMFFHPTVGMGVNFWILSRAWSALLVHRVTQDPRALTYAVDQIDWVLGKNPLGLCMFEGSGALNPPRYHHRYNMIEGRARGAVPGAIPNGIVRDMGIADRCGFDMSRGGGRSPSFRTSEPWLVHNMFYLLAASALEKSLEAQTKD
ncbi:MAG TPA: glycoside hydrolase family 9 protein [Pirellulales bacterium]|jgi:hypothetical protein|nr:glycoside hydrolase family 9 protein [Pirellulales bacterium]